MPLHPLAAEFSQVAGAYERGRPEYSRAAVGALAAELRLPAGAQVLDLAAGTGKLTRTLLACGLDVVAVEPLAELRGVLAANVGAERVHEGVAEAIPLPDDAVDAVTVGDAFHWFDHGPALAEIARVLRPGGGLAVLATIPDWTGATWAAPVGELMAARRPEHPFFDGPSWRDAVTAAGGWTTPWEIRVTTNQPARPERMVDYLASMSWVAAMPEAERAEMLAEVDGMVLAGTTPPELPVHSVIGLSTLA